MLRGFLVLLSLFSLLPGYLRAQGLQRLKLTPIDLYDEGDFYPHWVDSIGSSGNRIYTSSVQDAFILVLEPDGRVVQTIGKKGAGPGEFVGGVVAFSVFQDRVLALASPKDRFFHFASGEFVGNLKMKPVSNTIFHTGTANTFGFAEDVAVFPAFPGTGRLGFAYDLEGRITPVGELLYGKDDIQRLGKHPLINDTLWTYGDGGWFAVFRYENLIHRYDQNFKLVASFRPENPRLNLIREELANYNSQKLKFPPVLFKDVTFWDGALYLLSQRTLIRMNTDSGHIEASYDFHAEGEGFEEISGKGLNFKSFAILDDGTLVLGPAFVWDHFLLSCKMPSHPKKPVLKNDLARSVR